MNQRPITKLYYSIGEVSKSTSLKAYVLRYWETEFTELNPSKNRAGNRIYQLDDIKTIFQIKKLLYEDKFTIEGARQQMRKRRKETSGGEQLALSLDDMRQEDVLISVKQDLEKIVRLLKRK